MNAPTKPKPAGGHKPPPQTTPHDPATRPVVPAIPSESAVGEEDPGDYENACIHADDGERIGPCPSTPPRRKK